MKPMVQYLQLACQVAESLFKGFNVAFAPAIDHEGIDQRSKAE
jgi:hypothetical protein